MKKEIQPLYCRGCGKPITDGGHGNRRYCSDRCKRRADHRKDHKHRKAQMRAGFEEQVVFKKLYKRDGGICQICGQPVKYRRCETDVWGATIDHRIPLSVGGKHSMENCQLAHMGCNSIKSRSGDGFKIENIDAVAEKYGWPPREGQG